jgi:transcriptional regulator with XRE-family HTH domain
MNIPLSIKYALVKRSKKQKELAASLNVTGSYISAVAAGSKRPSFDFVIKCSLFFNMKVSEFIALGEE